jgi:hypothetical protein
MADDVEDTSWQMTWQLHGNHIAAMWRLCGSHVVLLWHPRGVDVAKFNTSIRI